MDPPGRSAKRARSEDLAGAEFPPLATEPTEAANPLPTSTTPSQEPSQPDAGGGEGGAGVDYISDLPDTLLGEIISRLSTKEAGRTQILASRWRRVWAASPLILDSVDLDTNAPPTKGFDAAQEVVARAVSHILSTHQGPCRRFCVLPYHVKTRPDTVDAWLRFPALNKLEELDIWHNRINRYPQSLPKEAPPATFRFHNTLRVATFTGCALLDSSIGGLHFPHLKQLAFEESSISEGSLHTMINSCPVLECLLLRFNIGFSCVRISSSSLRSIGVAGRHYELREVSIVDAPCLERLLFLQEYPMYTNVSVISAPKVETLGYLSEAKDQARLVIGATVIEGTRVKDLTAVVHNVKILAIQPWRANLDVVIGLMKCFPCLEKLYIKTCVTGNEMNRWLRKHRQFIESFDIRLKTIVLEHYQGTKAQVSFVSFFLLNARELELMTLVADKGAYNEAFFAEQHKVLQMEKRASRGARLHFTTETCGHSTHVNHVSDLAITNPFECSSHRIVHWVLA